MKTLLTERLILKAWREEDADDMFAYAKSPRVGPIAGWKPHESAEESRGIIRRFIERDETWAICLIDTGRVVGSVGLHTDTRRDLGRSRCRMLGYVLAEDCWGRGLMPEACRAVIRFAFEDLELEILSVMHFPANAQSARVIHKLGFIREGFLRRATLLYDGQAMDEVCYSMTREEYLSGLASR